MRRRGPLKPVILAALIYLAIVVAAAGLFVRSDDAVASPLLLLGSLGVGLFGRWYSRKHFK
jgi:hypothetical protein